MSREHVRNLILVLADTKRLLGMRYAEWILGAPELEAGIACASMAQDEWGHGRLLYALLKDFGDDVDAIEHGREPAQYCSMEALDRAPDSWLELVALNALVDGALSLQIESLAGSSYIPLRQRVQKILEEEQFHAAHGRAWMNRIARSNDDSRAALADAVRRYLPTVLAWFGPDPGASQALRDAGVVSGSGSEMRRAFLQRIAPLSSAAGMSPSDSTADPDWTGFDDAARRTHESTPDEGSIRKIRGDKNRAFLMD